MPNIANVDKPTLVIGAGRTASTYFVHQLRISLGSFQSIIENELSIDVYHALRNTWWAKDWKWVAEDGIVEQRILDSMRNMLITLFPSDLSHWTMKALWDKYTTELLDGLFPRARYVHLVRDPRTNIPSIVERVGWSLDQAQNKYVTSNESALEFEQFGARYIRIRQEDFVDDRMATWSTVCRFLNVDLNREGSWEAEENVSKSQSGRVGSKRQNHRLTWEELPPAVVDMGKRLGYGPKAPSCGK